MKERAFLWLLAPLRVRVCFSCGTCREESSSVPRWIMISWILLILTRWVFLKWCWGHLQQKQWFFLLLQPSCVCSPDVHVTLHVPLYPWAIKEKTRVLLTCVVLLWKWRAASPSSPGAENKAAPTCFPDKGFKCSPALQWEKSWQHSAVAYLITVTT